MYESVREPAFSYESVVDAATRLVIADRAARITAMRANMGAELGVFPVEWLEIADVRCSGTITQDSESGEYQMDVLNFDVEGRRPQPNSGLVVTYNSRTGVANAVHRSVWSSATMTRDDWQRTLADHLQRAFDDSLRTTIYEHWRYLVDHRSPEQAEAAVVQARTAFMICQGILSAQEWVDTGRYRFRSLITKSGVGITERQHRATVRPQPGLLKRLFGVERPTEWEPSTVTVAVGTTTFGIRHSETGPQVDVRRGPYPEESEKFRGPGQLHHEADLAKLLQEQAENYTYLQP